MLASGGCIVVNSSQPFIVFLTKKKVYACILITYELSLSKQKLQIKNCLKYIHICSIMIPKYLIILTNINILNNNSKTFIII